MSPLRKVNESNLQIVDDDEFEVMKDSNEMVANGDHNLESVWLTKLRSRKGDEPSAEAGRTMSMGLCN